jgi:hypothetical protein
MIKKEKKTKNLFMKDTWKMNTNLFSIKLYKILRSILNGVKTEKFDVFTTSFLDRKKLKKISKIRARAFL